MCDALYTSATLVERKWRFSIDSDSCSFCSCVRVDLIEKYNFQFALNNFLCTAVWDKVLQRSTGAVSQSQRDRKRVRERAREPESQASIRDAVRKKTRLFDNWMLIYQVIFGMPNQLQSFCHMTKSSLSL